MEGYYLKSEILGVDFSGKVNIVMIRVYGPNKLKSKLEMMGRMMEYSFSLKISYFKHLDIFQSVR